MAQALLDFFDEDYFANACTCDNSDYTSKTTCEIHGDIPQGKERKGKDTSSDSALLCLHQHIPAPATAQPSESGSVVPQVVINQSFPRQPTQDILAGMIEYRIKVLSSHKASFGPGEVKNIQTNVSVTRKPGRLSLLLKSPETIPLRFLSEGILDPTMRGCLSVTFENLSSTNIHLAAGSNVGFLILSPFIK